MRCDQYASVLNDRYLMGPNSMAMLEEMIEPHLDFFAGKRVMDLGCGQGLTTLFLAKEAHAGQIFATELWTPVNRLAQNFADWGIADRAYPIRGDGSQLPYADNFFDAIVSVDAYHYFGQEYGFFARKIWPLIKPGGYVMISFVGVQQEMNGDYPALMKEWAPDDFFTFHSKEWWEANLRCNITQLESLEVAQSALADQFWEDWFASGHPYAKKDQEFFHRGLGQYLNVISLVAKKAADPA